MSFVTVSNKQELLCHYDLSVLQYDLKVKLQLI